MKLLIGGLFLLCCVVTSGCADYAYWVGRTFYDIDCRPEVVEKYHGKCAYMKKGESHAETMRP
jgi:hypothetical protein